MFEIGSIWLVAWIFVGYRFQVVYEHRAFDACFISLSWTILVLFNNIAFCTICSYVWSKHDVWLNIFVTVEEKFFKEFCFEIACYYLFSCYCCFTVLFLFFFFLLFAELDGKEGQVFFYFIFKKPERASKVEQEKNTESGREEQRGSSSPASRRL